MLSLNSIFSVKFLGIHIVTLTAMIICFTLTYLRLTMHPLHRITISGIVTMLGVWFYDLVWLIGANNQLINWPRLMETTLLLSLLFYYNYVLKFNFIQVNKYFATVLIFFSFIMLYMGLTGWFKTFIYWVADQTLPDPANWLWAVSKVTGILMWTTLIPSAEIKKMRVCEGCVPMITKKKDGVEKDMQCPWVDKCRYSDYDAVICNEDNTGCPEVSKCRERDILERKEDGM